MHNIINLFLLLFLFLFSSTVFAESNNETISTSMVYYFIFWSSALLSIIGGGIVIFARSVIKSALGLLLTIFSLAILYLLLSATFIAVIQLIIYGGAIVVLFIFISSMIKIQIPLNENDPLLPSRYISVILILLSLAMLIPSLYHFGIEENNLFSSTNDNNITMIGNYLTSNYIFSFEAVSILLIIAIIGGMSIAKKEK